MESLKKQKRIIFVIIALCICIYLFAPTLFRDGLVRCFAIGTHVFQLSDGDVVSITLQDGNNGSYREIGPSSEEFVDIIEALNRIRVWRWSFVPAHGGWTNRILITTADGTYDYTYYENYIIITPQFDSFCIYDPSKPLLPLT